MVIGFKYPMQDIYKCQSYFHVLSRMAASHAKHVLGCVAKANQHTTKPGNLSFLRWHASEVKLRITEK